jgi:hypothetical protein
MARADPGRHGRADFPPPAGDPQPALAEQGVRPPEGSTVPVPIDGSDSDTNKYAIQLMRFAKDGTSHVGFAKTVSEQIALGRVGALVDVPEGGRQAAAQSFAVAYAAENIVDWSVEDVGGFYVPTRVLLREFKRDDRYPRHPAEPVDRAGLGRRRRPSNGRKARALQGGVRRNGGGPLGISRRRRLHLRHHLPRAGAGDPGRRRAHLRPVPLQGRPDRAAGTTASCPPSGACRCRSSRSSSSAPAPTPPTARSRRSSTSSTSTSPTTAPMRSWSTAPSTPPCRPTMRRATPTTTPPSTTSGRAPSGKCRRGSKPGIIEYTGTGLEALEKRLNDKEAQIAAIGGRLMPGMSKSVSESNNQSTLREANEQALLLNVIMALEEGMTALVRYWLMFRDVPLSADPDPALRDRHHLPVRRHRRAVAARDPAALRGRSAAGRRALRELRPQQHRPLDHELDEFKRKMDDPNSFVGQPDAAARCARLRQPGAGDRPAAARARGRHAAAPDRRSKSAASA